MSDKEARRLAMMNRTSKMVLRRRAIGAMSSQRMEDMEERSRVGPRD